MFLSKPGWADLNSANLTPASGRQDHTILPYAATSLVRSLGDRSRAHRPPCNPVARKTLPRPPHPHPASVTIAIRPSCGVGWREFVEMICPTGEAKYFCKGDSTQKCPTGKSDREVTTNRPAGATDLGAQEPIRIPDAATSIRLLIKPRPRHQVHQHIGVAASHRDLVAVDIGG